MTTVNLIPQIKSLFEKGETVSKIAKTLGLKYRYCYYILKEKLGNNIVRKSKFELDYQLFLTNLHTEHTYYLLGYLYSDGCINEIKGSINITSKDEEILIKLSKIVGNNCQIRKNKSDYYYLEWYSKDHINQLKSLGCFQNKSLLLKFPTMLNDNLIHHFIRGYFDGDGSIGYYNRIGKNKRPSKVLKVSFAGTSNFLSTLKIILNSKGSINKTSNSAIFVLQYSGNISSKKVLDYIYNNATIYMERKHKIFKGFIQQRHFIE